MCDLACIVFIILMKKFVCLSCTDNICWTRQHKFKIAAGMQAKLHIGTIPLRIEQAWQLKTEKNAMPRIEFSRNIDSLLFRQVYYSFYKSYSYFCSYYLPIKIFQLPTSLVPWTEMLIHATISFNTLVDHGIASTSFQKIDLLYQHSKLWQINCRSF